MQVLGEEEGGAVEGLVGFVELPDEGLEDVRHSGGDVEDDVDVRVACFLGEAHGVVEQQFVRADL
jgi:hypothetical protein